MDRRTVLKYTGAGVLATTAGCASVQEQGGTTTDATTASGGDSDDTEATEATEETTTTGPAGTAQVWYSLSESELETRESVVQQFNDQSRHTVEGSDISDLAKKTTSAIPANQGPQVFEWAHDWVGDYYQRGFVVDQSDELSVSLDQFTDAAAGAVQFDGNVVGLPHGAETVALVYNEDMVDSPPETVSEMESIMEEHHDPQNGTYGLSSPVNSYFLSGWAQAFGGYYFDPEEDPMLGLTQSETIEGFEFFFDTLASYMPQDAKYGPQVAAFADGNAPFAVNGPWFLSTTDEKGLNVGITELPAPEGGSPSPYTGITIWYFSKAMQEGGPSAEAARSFVEWYATDEERSLQAAKNQGTIPVLDSLANSDELPSKVQGFSNAVQQGVPMPTRPKMNKVWGPLKTAIRKSFTGDADVQSAMETAESEIRSNWE